MPQSEVCSVFQDSRGYIWLGTHSGVCRYNGTYFKVFDKSSGMSSYTILSIAEDSDGLLYFGTLGGGLNIFDGDTFEHVTFGDNDPKNSINNILIEEDNRIWLATQGGLVSINGEEKQTYSTGEGLPDDFCLTVFRDSLYRLWVGTHKGLAYLNGERFAIPKMPSKLGEQHVYSMIQDREGVLWFSTTDGLWRREKSEIIKVPPRKGLPDTIYLCSAIDREGELWFGTISGLVHYANDKFNHYTTRNGLSNDLIEQIKVDREGNVWLATDTGASKLSKGPFIYFDEKSGLISGLIGAVYEDSRNRIWVGTGSGITVIDGEDMWSLTTDDGLTSPVINAFAEGADGSIVIGTTDSLMRWDGANLSMVGKRGGILSLLCDRRGRVWASARGVKIWENNRISELPSDNPLSNTLIDAIAEDREGKIWFGTRTAGCIVFDGREYVPFGEELGLDDVGILALEFDKLGRLWIGTQGEGVYCWDGRKFSHFTKENGLSSNFVWTILADSDCCIWLYTNKGIDRYDGESFKHFNCNDGLAAEEGVTNSSIEDHKGRLWFGSAEGLNLYTKERTFVNKTPPPVYIETMTVNDEAIGDRQNLVFEPDQNNIKFDFVGLSFRNEDDVRFKYFLQGLDKEWSEASDERSMRYASLPPGNYVFKVKACNDDGYWSDEPAEIGFSILSPPPPPPPFYSTWWFFTSALGGLILLFITVHYWRVLKVKREKEILEEHVRERTRDLAAVNQELKAFNYSVSHDLRGLLWTIGEYGEIIEDEYSSSLDSQGVDMLHRITAASGRMTRLLDDLMKLSSASRGQFERVEFDLSAIVKSAIYECRQKEPDRDVEVVIADGIHACGVERLVRVVIDNLIGNAWKFTRENKSARIEFGVKDIDGRQVLFVNDNGIGFDMDQADELFLPFKRLSNGREFEGSGIGLTTVQRIIERHDGKIWAESKPGEGTTFYFTLQGNKK